jgi:hypothetical protein
MNLKVKIREELRKRYGNFDSILEHQYEDVITEKLVDGPLVKRSQWATYNQIILEIKYSLKDMLKVKELLYKLTEDENPNDMVIEAIEDIKTFTPELERLYYKIKNF